MEPVEEVVSDRCLDQQSGAGEAHLARIVELPRGAVGGSVKVGVGEHDQRSLPSQLGRERNDVLGRRSTDVASRCR